DDRLAWEEAIAQDRRAGGFQVEQMGVAGLVEPEVEVRDVSAGRVDAGHFDRRLELGARDVWVARVKEPSEDVVPRRAGFFRLVRPPGLVRLDDVPDRQDMRGPLSKRDLRVARPDRELDRAVAGEAFFG